MIRRLTLPLRATALPHEWRPTDHRRALVAENDLSKLTVEGNRRRELQCGRVERDLSFDHR